MSKGRFFCGASLLAAALGLAAQAQAQTGSTEVGEVVVTGSFIRGTPEDAALPVDVIGGEDLAKQGSPSAVELIKALPSSQGVLGDSNQFDGRSQGQEGVGTINLRGLGAARTLVLFNGRRVALSANGAVDTNLLPLAAVGRIEVLKDGAAATYGSEAIGGVVNLIAPTTFDGLELHGDWTFIDGSEGDWGGYVKWGWSNDRANAFVAADFRHRSRLQFTKRDFTSLPFAANPEGGWSSISLPTFIDLASGPAAVRFDSGCTPLGGTFTPVGCQVQFGLNDNLVEPEDRYSIYGQFNFDIDEDTTFHMDAMYARGVVTMSTSPGYALLAGPSSTFSPVAGRYFVPASNPGLRDYVAKNPGQFPNGNAGVVLAAYRPFAFDGNPLFNGRGPAQGKRDYEMWRVSGDVRGKLPVADIGWNLALTYSQNSSYLSQSDTEISRFQLALNGLGGPDCNRTTGTPGVGPCMYFNPFSNSAAANPITGGTNPGFTASSPRNSPELVRWFFRENSREVVNRLVVAELVFDGTLPGLSLPGGEIGWAVGAQYRRNQTEQSVSPGWDVAINPCPDTPITGNRSCALETGPLAFLGTFAEQDLEQDVYAAFAEVQIPITDDLNVQAAARYEDYGGGVGGTFDPKVSARWQINDMFAVRGSLGTTFRAPPANNLEGRVTTLQFFGGNYRPVDIVANPSLKPESAVTWSVGGIVRAGGLRATVDYWSFDFQKPIVAEPFDAIVATMFPGGASTNCGNPAFAGLQARFQFFSGTACAVTNVARLRTGVINGADQKTSGIDALADFDFPEPMFGVDVTIGGSFSYVLEYKVDRTEVEGLVVQPAFNAVNFLNQGQSVVPLPDWKAQAYVELTRGVHNLRFTANYISSYIDQRAAPYLPLASLGGQAVLRGRKIDETLLVDAAYRVLLPWDTTLVVRVQNVFDDDPSFARLAPGYDPFTGNPLGRTLKIGVTKKVW
ncbi:MAG: TonB-dependent receptor [Phenylobacterium sp.]|uniref:TonB-dependent receptor domain-containing protein n=1 Tax=Phenylobacterium sp. TaxID=1871053 RepID=UPI001A37EFCA|nr:TonB-dependent receptor [Phenylobacterium sp.]MBL8770847.1 TonB-dependent receptor [Phenylobacterium sp.]